MNEMFQQLYVCEIPLQKAGAVHHFGGALQDTQWDAVLAAWRLQEFQRRHTHTHTLSLHYSQFKHFQNDVLHCINIKYVNLYDVTIRGMTASNMPLLSSIFLSSPVSVFFLSPFLHLYI
jgi:hypothetical protein